MSRRSHCWKAVMLNPESDSFVCWGGSMTAVTFLRRTMQSSIFQKQPFYILFTDTCTRINTKRGFLTQMPLLYEYLIRETRPDTVRLEAFTALSKRTYLAGVLGAIRFMWAWWGSDWPRDWRHWWLARATWHSPFLKPHNSDGAYFLLFQNKCSPLQARTSPCLVGEDGATRLELKWGLPGSLQRPLRGTSGYITTT